MKARDAENDHELIQIIDNAFQRLEGFMTPRCIWREFKLIHFDGGIEIEGARIFSKDIARLTARADKCILIAATLGHEVDRQISLAQQKNMLEGLALDSAASVQVDEFLDEYIKNQIVPGLKAGEFLTSRFSPGYGDLKMEVTEEIISLLNASKQIGLSVTCSMMMSPIKSVTAVIGFY